MSIAAQYVSLPRNAPAPAGVLPELSVANTARNGTGTLVTVFTAGRRGSRIERLRVIAPATTTAGMVRFYLSADGGTTKRLVHELAVTAITVSGTVAGFTSDLTLTNAPWLVLEPNAILYAAPHNAETFNVHVIEGGDF